MHGGNNENAIQFKLDQFAKITDIKFEIWITQFRGMGKIKLKKRENKLNFFFLSSNKLRQKYMTGKKLYMAEIKWNKINKSEE